MRKDRELPATHKWVIERVAVRRPDYVTTVGSSFGKNRRYRQYLQKGSSAFLARWVVDLARAAVFNSYVTAWRRLKRLAMPNEVLHQITVGDVLQRARRLTRQEMRVYLGRVIERGDQVIRRNREARREGRHELVWWRLRREGMDAKQDPDEHPGWYSPDGKWVPWENMGKEFYDRAEAEAMLTGYVIAEDGFQYAVHEYSEQHWDRVTPDPGRCSACTRGALLQDGNKLISEDELAETQQRRDEGDRVESEKMWEGMGREAFRPDEIPDSPPDPSESQY